MLTAELDNVTSVDEFYNEIQNHKTKIYSGLIE